MAGPASVKANDARSRGRGRRGQPNRAQENEIDVRLAIRELEVAHAVYLAIVNSDPSDIERRTLMREARDRVERVQQKVALASRFLEAVIDRPAK